MPQDATAHPDQLRAEVAARLAALAEQVPARRKHDGERPAYRPANDRDPLEVAARLAALNQRLAGLKDDQ